MANPPVLLIAIIAVLLVVVLVVVAMLVSRRGTAGGAAEAITNALAVFDPEAATGRGISGAVRFSQPHPSRPTLVKIDVSGFAPGTTHGIHVHRCGDLSSGCASACDHFNPLKHLHGNRALYGRDRHVGDLCNNITADDNGRASVRYYDDLVSLSGPHSVVGRAVVIHADPDDLGKYRGDGTPQGAESGKTGNAGKRIACAVIGISREAS